MILDEECWLAYPKQRLLYNKLWISDMLGYECGPGGLTVQEDGDYIVKPIYNLDGMSRGAQKRTLLAGDTSTPPGYFWCEYFEGPHYSVDFVFTDEGFKQCLVVEGIKENEYMFTSWTKLPLHKYKFDVPTFVDILCGDYVEHMNIEYIGSNIIEIHLRHNPDFVDHDFSKIEVVWASTYDDQKHQRNKDFFIQSKEFIVNHEGHIIDTRLGFYLKGIKGGVYGAV
jgi:hypothetical protein